MYDARAPLADTKDLNQGDILRGILRPLTPTAKNFAILRDGNKFQYPAPPEKVSNVDKELRIVLTPQREEFSLVVSNSCDNALGSLPILLIPTTPFKFQSATPEEQWEEVSQAATGTADSKTFYLPSSHFGLPRLEARFNQIFAVSHDYLERCVKDAGSSRVCGLNPEAQRHLQWALDLFFGRHPREDFDWPSDEDLALKEKWLESKLSSGGGRHREKFRVDLQEVKKRLERK